MSGERLPKDLSWSFFTMTDKGCHMSKSVVVQTALSFAALCAFQGASNAASFSFEKIDVPGAPRATVEDINDEGDVIGDFPDITSESHGYVYHKGRTKQIDYPGADSTYLHGINNKGQIVGHYLSINEGGLPHGFVLSHGTYTQLDVPYALYTILTGINDSGVVAGMFFGAESGDPYQHGFRHDIKTPGSTYVQIPVEGYVTLHGRITESGAVIGQNTNESFIYSDEGVTFPSFPFGSVTNFNDLNDGGSIVGSYSARDTHYRNAGFVWSNGSLTKIVAPNAKSTIVSGINDAGIIVGIGYDDDVQNPMGFVYADGRFRPLKAPGAAATSPVAINRSGQIAGLATDGKGRVTPFLATRQR